MNLLSALIDIWIGKAFLGCLAWLFRSEIYPKFFL